jgi:DNA-directed RNA polymerase specialized sigma subunit
MINIEKLFETYLDKKSIVSTRQQDIKALEKVLEYDEIIKTETRDEAIAGDALQTNVLSQTPRSETNKFHSKTENTALNYKNNAWFMIGEEVYYRESLSREERKRIVCDIIEIKRDILPLETEVNKIDAAMQVLEEKEHYVTELYYIKGYTIEDIRQVFIEKYKYGSRNTIKDIKESAVTKMNSIINRKKTA